jgi:hypothetical protein
MKGVAKMFVFRCNDKLFINVIGVFLSPNTNNTTALKIRTSGLYTTTAKEYASYKEAVFDFNRICNELKIGKTYIEVK